MNVALIIIAFVLGSIVGGIISTIIFEKKLKSQKVLGTLKVNYSDPDGPYMFLALNTDISTLSKQDYVVLGVDLSQN